MEEHNLNWWLGQIIGIIAFSITALGFLQKDEKKLKTLLTISGFFWMANFWFLGAMTPFVITLVNTIRQFISRIYHDSSEKFRTNLTYLFVVINVVMGIISWQNWISFFPTFAAVMATISLFIWESKRMRSGLLTSEFCWTINNLYFMNFGGLCANTLNIPLLIYHIMKKDPITMIEKDS